MPQKYTLISKWKVDDKMCKKLVIIGNGFDLVHGLNTKYTDFFDSLPNSMKKTWLDILGEFKIEKDYWYCFEEAIEKVTFKWFHDEDYGYFYSVANQENILIQEKRIEFIYQIYGEIERRLMHYLTGENKKVIVKKDSISDYIGIDAKVISFNYTDTSKRYSKNVFFIHGSLQENFILLGYKPRMVEHDLISSIATKRAKRRLREMLNYHRYLISREVSSDMIATYMDAFNIHLDCLFSGRGGYPIDYSPELEREIRDSGMLIYELLEPSSEKVYKEKELQNYFLEKMKKERLKQVSEILNDYMEKNKFNLGEVLPKVNYENICEIAILGHSLEADDDIIKELVSKCANLKNFVLYSYEGESLSDLKKKKSKLNSYSNIPIELRSY